MIEDKFFEELTKISGWKFQDRFGVIRNTSHFSGHHHCPITGVCESVTRVWYRDLEWENAATELGLDFIFSENVARAADNEIEDILERARLRKRLLQATGLTE